MAGFTPANGDLLQIRTVCYTPEQISMNVLHYQVVTQGIAPMDLGRMALALDNQWNDPYKALMSSASKWRGVGVQNLMVPRTLEYTNATHTGDGTAGAAMAPTQASFLIKIRAPLAGRKNRGRIYPGLMSMNHIAATGELTIGGSAALQDLIDTLGPAINLAQDGQTCLITLTVRHPDAIVAGVRVPQWSTADLITGSLLIATQRRRGDYGQHNSIPF